MNATAKRAPKSAQFCPTCGQSVNGDGSEARDVVDLLGESIFGPRWVWSSRALGVLHRLEVRKVRDLVAMSPSELMAQPNCGHTTFTEIRLKLATVGLALLGGA